MDSQFENSHVEVYKALLSKKRGQPDAVRSPKEKRPAKEKQASKDKPTTKEVKEKTRPARRRAKSESPRRRPASPKARGHARRKNDIRSIGKDTGNDCCACIKLLAEYIKEITKLICCITNEKTADTETRFGQLFCDLGDITIRLGRDMFYLAKFLLSCIARVLSPAD